MYKNLCQSITLRRWEEKEKDFETFRVEAHVGPTESLLLSHSFYFLYPVLLVQVLRELAQKLQHRVITVRHPEPCTYALTPRANWELPVHLTCMFLDCGEMCSTQREMSIYWWEHGNYTHTHRLWCNSNRDPLCSWEVKALNQSLLQPSTCLTSNCLTSTCFTSTCLTSTVTSTVIKSS